MVLLHAILLLDLGELVDLLDQLYEVVAVLGVPARLDQSQALLQLLLQALVDVVTTLSVLHERQLHESHTFLV
jgi:hypothetical protein